MRTKRDLFSTYDSRTIVSNRFKAFCEAKEVKGTCFFPLNPKGTLYLFTATDILEFDSERRGTRFVDKCGTCEKFKSVVGATPAYLKELPTDPHPTFYRSDLEFGSGREKNPLLFVNASLAKLLEQEFGNVLHQGDVFGPD